MSDIKFACPKCNQSLEAPEEMKGATIECPTCKESLTIPNPQFKKCPFCAEEIKFDAVKCKHCGEMLNKPKAPPVSPAASFPPRVPVQSAIPRTPASTPAPAKVQTIELTSKKYKAQGCLAGILLMIAVIVFVGGATTESSGRMDFAGLLFFVALVWSIVVRILIWWHHE